MTAFEVVAGVIAAFFCCGIALGVLFVIVLGRGGGGRPRGRRYRRSSRSDTGPEWQGRLDQPGREEPPGPEDDDNPPRWPGGTSA